MRVTSLGAVRGAIDCVASPARGLLNVRTEVSPLNAATGVEVAAGLLGEYCSDLLREGLACAEPRDLFNSLGVRNWFDNLSGWGLTSKVATLV